MNTGTTHSSGADSRKPRVLIIDDDVSNLAIVSEFLSNKNYEILVAEDGQIGLERARFARPDLILLDVLMPGIDGLETCRRLKADETTRDIPVIFMTALADTDNKIKGFTAGAVDYVTKPSQREEVLARVGVHLRIRELTSNLQEANEFLERRVQERTAELARANQELRAEITEREQVQKALQESEERFRALYEDNPSMYFTVDEQGVVLSVNPFGAGQLGYTVQDLVGQPVLGVFHPDDKEKLQRQFEECLNNPGQVFHWELRKVRKDGSTMWVGETARSVRGDNGEVLVLVVCEDITERKQVEVALREEKAFTDSALDTITDAFLVFDLDGSFIRWNRVLNETTGYGNEDIAIMKLTDFIGEKHIQKVARAFESVIIKGRTSLEATVVTKENQHIPFEFTGGLLTGPDGNPLSVCIVGRDIRDRRILEEQLRQAAKMEAIGRLAGGVAHDFNNLMTVIMGYSDLMLRRVPADTPLRRDLEQIRKAGDRASSLTNHLLAFSRNQVVQPKVLDLNVVVADTKKLLGRLIGEHIELECISDPALWRVLANPELIEQVIINLAINARDAMPRGGKLTIETQNVHLDDIYARMHVGVAPGNYVMIAASDTGSGMDAETMSLVFEPFFTTKEEGKGTGLGLAMVYGIVKQYGGHIWVYSEPGHGTTFKVYLPQAEDETETVGPDIESAEPVRGGSETILLVEDNDMVRDMASTCLRLKGYNVFEASDGEEALKICKDHQGPLEMLVTDVVMPRMSGYELAKEVESLRPAIRVLYVSGYTGNAVAHYGEWHSELVLLQKPFTPEALAYKVREILDEPHDAE